MRKLALFALISSSVVPLHGANAQIFQTNDNPGIGGGQVGIFNCDAPGTKQRNGAIIGAVLGGVIGNKVSDDNKTMGTVIGAAVGGAAGSYIGCRLQRRDQERLAADNERALATGQNASWTNEESGVSANTQVISNTSAESRDLTLARGVQAPSRLILIGGRYSATRDMVLRAGPAANTRSVGGIGATEQIDVLGRTSSNTQNGSAWAAVESGGVLIGYVPLSGLRSLGRIAAADQLEGEPNTRTVKVPVTTVCRNVSQNVKVASENETQTASSRACVQPDGSWKTL